MTLCGSADHTTIAKFVSGNAERVKGLFTEVMLYCHELGLIGGEMFAADGCRLPSNAAKEWSGTTEKLKSKREKFEAHAEKLLAAHNMLDQSEDEGSTAKERARLEKAALKFKRKADYIGRFLESEKAGERRVGVSGKEIQSNVTGVFANVRHISKRRRGNSAQKILPTMKQTIHISVRRAGN
jgi:hypothetical protein